MMNFRLIDAAKVQQFFESANFFKIFLSIANSSSDFFNFPY